MPIITRKRQILYFRVFLIFILIFLVLLLWDWLSQMGMQYEWQWNRVWRHFGHFNEDGFTPGPILKGIGVTIAITAPAIFLSACAGLCAAIFRLSPWPVCIMAAKIYTALWRNTPLLLQLFIAYFLISPLLHMGPMWTAIWALTLFEGAYLAEIFRSGLLGVSRTQWEAGLSLGLSLGQTFRLVILPQAIRNIHPTLTNQAISILKDSSLVSAIAIADLTMQSQAIIAETFLAFEIWLLAGAIYLLLALCISLPSLWLENRVRWQPFG